MKALGALLLAAFTVSLLAAGAQAASPASVTGSVSNLSTTSVRLNGSVDPNGESTSWYFEFGTDDELRHEDRDDERGLGPESDQRASNVSGLSVATILHYRLVAMNASGTTLGADRTFITEGPPTSPPARRRTRSRRPPRSRARSIRTAARRRGTSTTARRPRMARRRRTATPVRDQSSVAISEGLSNLTPNTTYHFRLVASNSAGTSTGADGTFVTRARRHADAVRLPRRRRPLRAPLRHGRRGAARRLGDGAAPDLRHGRLRPARHGADRRWRLLDVPRPAARRDDVRRERERQHEHVRHGRRPAGDDADAHHQGPVLDPRRPARPASPASSSSSSASRATAGSR